MPGARLPRLAARAAARDPGGDAARRGLAGAPCGSPLRDVAGMLRSFDYVRGAHPDPTSEQAVAWCRSARRGFLDGYCAGAVPEPSVLHAYELDKAIYEVVYETRNRPEWVHIPLRAVHDVAGRTAQSPTHNQEEN